VVVETTAQTRKIAFDEVRKVAFHLRSSPTARSS
jgi:hypothetical protein